MPPVSPTYPGVYIEEIPSGNRTIVGVQTSITAFVGRTPAGPLDEPKTCFNYGDFERFFGSRSYQYPLTYAVEDFFLNGGSQAVVVRAFHNDPAVDDLIGNSTAKFKLAGGLPIWAVGPGAWGNDLTIAFDYLGLRTAGATPAKASVAIQVTPPVAAGQVVTVTATPKAGSSDPAGTATYTTSGGESALAIAQGLAADFNGKGFPDFGAAVAQPGIDNQHAALILATAVKDTAANGSFTVTAAANTPAVAAAPAVPASPGVPAKPAVAAVAASPSASVTMTPDTAGFNGAGPQQAKAASAKLTVAGTPTAGTLTVQVPLPNSRPAMVTVPVVPTDTPAGVAKNLATALTQKVAGPGGLLKPVTLDPKDPTTLIITAATPGLAANTATLKPLDPLPGITLTADPVAANGVISLAGGIDSGYDTSLADIAAKPYLHYGVTGSDLFNVTITYSPKGKLPTSERYTGVSVAGDDSPTRIDRVINPQSLLVVVNPKGVPNRQKGDFAPYPAAVTFQNPGQPAVPLGAAGGKDSDPLQPADLLGDELERTGMYALEEVDLFNLMCIPPDQRADEHSAPGGDDGSGPFPSVYAEAAEFCAKRRAMLICDPPRTWAEHANSGLYNLIVPTDVGVTTEDGGRNSAVFFPYIYKADMEMNGKSELFAPSGSVAGKFAFTDLTRGVWKAPAGMETGLEGVTELDVKMTDDQNGVLNPLGINAIRYFPIIGPVIWGSRTLRGADVFADDYKYISVRRLTLYIEESLYRGTKWAVFEPNSDSLWSQLRLSVGTFMADLARQGAFYGYSVICDKSTTLQSDIDKGIVNVVVAFAPVKPAEFVVLKIAQLAGQTPG